MPTFDDKTLHPSAVIKYIDQCFSNLLKEADKKKIKHLCMPFLAEGKGLGYMLLIFIVFCDLLCFIFFVCLSLSCVANVASVSGMSILDCPFGFH
jgi:hypothetical protein